MIHNESRSDRPGQKQRRIRRRLQAYRASRTGRVRRRIPPSAVPSFFTLMNLFCGFVAIIQAFEGRLDNAVWLIVLAGFFDLLDGMMARLTGASSPFGAELDSLADIVSFGVAPGIVVYVFGLGDLGTIGLIVSSLPAICGAVRLARYNVNFGVEKEDYFIGLPVPAAAVALVTVMIALKGDQSLKAFGPSGFPILVPIVVVLCALMISNIRFDTVPKPSARYLRAHPRKAVLFALALVLVVILQQFGLLIILIGYLGIGIGRAIWKLIQAIRSAEILDDDGDTAI